MRTIRQTEAGELAALRRDYDARMDRAAANYERAVGRVEDVFDNRNAPRSRQVSRLRKQKAKAEGASAKPRSRKRSTGGPNAAVKTASSSRKKSPTSRPATVAKKPRSAAASSPPRGVQQNDAEAIVTLRNRGKRIYNSTVRTLQARRVDQLHDLESKLNAGRAAIARMPVKS